MKPGNDKLAKDNWLKPDSKVEYQATIKPYTVKEMCDLYGIGYKAFNTLIEPFDKLIGIRTGWYFSALQVEVIFSKLGVPYTITEGT